MISLVWGKTPLKKLFLQSNPFESLRSVGEDSPIGTRFTMSSERYKIYLGSYLVCRFSRFEAALRIFSKGAEHFDWASTLCWPPHR